MNKFASFLILITTCITAHAQVRPEMSRLFDELKGIGIENLDIIKSGGLDGPYQLHYSIALDYRPKHYRKASGPALDSLLQRDRSLQEQRLAAVRRTLDELQAEARESYHYEYHHEGKDTIVYSMNLTHNNEWRMVSGEHNQRHFYSDESLYFSYTPYLQKEMGYAGRLNYLVTLPQDSFDITPYTEEMLAADIDSLFRLHRIKPRKALWQHDQEYSKAYLESIKHTGDYRYCRGGGDIDHLEGITNATIYTVPLDKTQQAQQLLAAFDSLAQQYAKHLHSEAHYTYNYNTTFKEPIWAPMLTITSVDGQLTPSQMYTCELDLKRDEFGYHFVVAQTHGTLWMPRHWPSTKSDINGQRTYFKGMKPKEERK